jgi:hypothetical protein
MALQLKPATERMVLDEVQRGTFHSADEVILQAIQALHESSNALPPSPEKLPLGQFLVASPLRMSGLKIERNQS